MTKNQIISVLKLWDLEPFWFSGKPGTSPVLQMSPDFLRINYNRLGWCLDLENFTFLVFGLGLNEPHVSLKNCGCLFQPGVIPQAVFNTVFCTSFHSTSSLITLPSSIHSWMGNSSLLLVAVADLPMLCPASADCLTTSDWMLALDFG